MKLFLTHRPGPADVVFVLGLAALLYGLSLIYRPLPWIVGGVLAMWIAFTVTKGEPRR